MTASVIVYDTVDAWQIEQGDIINYKGATCEVESISHEPDGYTWDLYDLDMQDTVVVSVLDTDTFDLVQPEEF